MRTFIVNMRLIAVALAVPVACLLSADPFRLAAQSPSTYQVDANWAPPGTTWSGNTSWIAADGKGRSDWGYATIPVVGPLVGAALAGLVVAAVGF